jgi:tetratricopeptide (TPR) repeat protein
VEANVEAVILKGFLLRKFNKSQQAIVQYQEAVKISPGHFYANEGLVQCLLDCHRYRSAELVAQSMLRAVGQSGRAFMLCAISYSRDKANRKKVQQALIKALSLDATLSTAYLMLSESYRSNSEFSKAIEILETGISQIDTSAYLSFHLALADLLQLVGRTRDAMEHCSAALRLDADCIQAHVSLQQMEAIDDTEQPPSDFMVLGQHQVLLKSIKCPDVIG